MTQDILTGKIEAFWETGCEGQYWSFYEDGKTDYDALHILEKGDLLTIFNDVARTEKIWEGEIDFDYNACKQPNPKLPAWIVQWVDCIGWVNGVQKGIDPETWAKMFQAEKPATLVKAKSPTDPKI